MNLDEIINEHTMHEFWIKDDREEIKQCMRIAVKQALELAIKSFPSHEHPDIAKSILNVMDEIE